MEVEQITKNIEESQVQKQKDPKKVAAGKTLARKNAEARKLKSNESEEQVDSPNTISTIYDGVKSIAGVVGVGLTLYQGYQFYKSYRAPAEVSQESHTPPAEVSKSSQDDSETTKKPLRKTMEF